MSKEAKVVKVLSPNEIVVNLGSADGVDSTSRFLVFTLGGELKDPDTGESLGVLEIVRGRGEAKHVQERLTTVRSIERNINQAATRPLLGVPGANDPAPFDNVSVGDLVRLL